MGNKTLSLTNAELEFAQKIRLHFPRGVFSSGDLKRMNGAKAEDITARLIETFSGWPVVENEYLKLISGGESLILSACDGTRIIPDMTGLFTAGIDPDFRNYSADEKGQTTGEIPVRVLEMAKDGMFVQMFGSLFGISIVDDSANDRDIAKFIKRYQRDLERICLTQDQIIGFVEKFPNWLREDGYATFFPYKSYKNFFVARVRVPSGGRLEARVRRLGRSGVWGAEHRRRVVVPQLA